MPHVAIEPSIDPEASLAARAAWLHYGGGLTQAEVARRLGVNSLKAHRLIGRANRDGLVRVFIDGPVSECVALEDALVARYGLTSCEVAPDIDSPGDGRDLPLRALGIAGAQFIKHCLDGGTEFLIGVGHGRTLAAAVERLPACRTEAAFVSLIGGLSRKFAANPHDVIHRLAERTGAQAYVMPIPFYANSAADREVLLAQRGIADVFDLARSSGLKLVGIGSTDPEASLVATGMIESVELDAVLAAGGVGECLGHFFDGHGRAVPTELGERIASLSLDDLAASRIVALAGGPGKRDAIAAVLASGTLDGLITDERTARALLAMPAAAPLESFKTPA